MSVAGGDGVDDEGEPRVAAEGEVLVLPVLVHFL